MLRSVHTPLPTVLLAVPLLLASACKEDEGPNTAFDETKGVWSVVSYDLTGSGIEQVTSTREDGFLLRFVAEEKGKGVVAAAACQDSGGNHWPNNSTCHIDPDSTWLCRCFAYEFEENEMRWLEFPFGEAPPADVPDVDPGGDPMGVTVVNVEVDEETAAEVLFQPLPEGVFGSREEPPSVFRFRQRAETVWNNGDSSRPPNDPPSVCDPCFPGG
ncbi:MAG: hypothetical protein D6705_16950 [Deltaproteobacteria bacterium]|nr:MAG: hypothetical protein D6705_16950 [Deltaproteobacteria bacterium]